jgi:hypothetical protein
VRAKERRQTNKRMRESEARQKITRHGRGFVREGELTGQVRGAAHLQDRAVRRVKGTMSRGLRVKKGWRDGKLDRRRRTPVQSESAMSGGGAEARVARAEAGVIERTCAGGSL